MIIYQTVPRFNPKTGKPMKPDREWKEIRCDFSGRVVDSLDGEYSNYYCSYVLDYQNKDSCMGASGEEYEFGAKHKIDMHEFLSQPYVIFQDAYTGESEEHKFLKSLAKYESLDDALRSMRIKTAKKLIK